jgi:hypothetical protein
VKEVGEITVNFIKITYSQTLEKHQM